MAIKSAIQMKFLVKKHQVFCPWGTAMGSNANGSNSWGQTLGVKLLMLHNYRSRQFHRIWNEENPFSSCRDKSFTPSGKPIGGKWPTQCTITGLDISIELPKENICPAFSEICISQSVDPKFCSDMIPYNGITLKPIWHRIWITIAKSCAKWAPDCDITQVKLTSEAHRWAVRCFELTFLRK